MFSKPTYRAGSSKYVTPGIGQGPVIEARQRLRNIVPVVRGVDLIQKGGDLDIKNPFVAE